MTTPTTPETKHDEAAGIRNYTAEREQLVGEESLDDILAAIKAKAAERPGESASPKKTMGQTRKGR
jgi:hypothetical protein